MQSIETSDAETREDLRVIPPDGCDPDVGRWLWALQDTREQTVRAVAGVTQSTLDWMPLEGGNSIGSLLYHIALIEFDWLYAEVLEGRGPYPPDMAPLFPADARDAEGRLSAVLAEPLDAHLERLARVRDRLLAVFREMSAKEFRRARNLPQYDVTPEWVLHHLIQHEAEHRGHIGLLRARAEGGSPPQ
jgi:uncharacterized damage-inducible protein DinB